MKNDPSHVTVSFRFPIAPAPVPLGFAAASAAIALLPMAVAPAPLVAPDTAAVELAEPYVPERPQLPTQDVGFNNDDILQTEEPLNSFPSDSSDRSIDTTCIYSAYISNCFTANNSESPKAQSSSADLSTFYDFRPKIPPRDYHEKAIQNQKPAKVGCNPVSEPAVASNHLTPSQKRDVIIYSCQQTQKTSK